MFLLLIKETLKITLKIIMHRNPRFKKLSKKTPFWIQTGKWIARKRRAFIIIEIPLRWSVNVKLSSQPLKTISSVIPTNRTTIISRILKVSLTAIFPYSKYEPNKIYPVKTASTGRYFSKLTLLTNISFKLINISDLKCFISKIAGRVQIKFFISPLLINWLIISLFISLSILLLIISSKNDHIPKK